MIRLAMRPCVASLLAAVCALPGLPVRVRADEQTIRCESKDFRYRYCRADTDNRVTMTREMSKRRCRQWNNWGYDKRGVWVDNGCRGEFRVGRSGMSGGQAAAVGVAAGAAIIAAAVIASRNNDKRDPDVPDWAPGVYRGYDKGWRGDIELTVLNTSAVEGFVVNREEDRFTGRIEKDMLFLGPDEFRISRDGDGFRASHTSDRSREIRFRKIR
jgi:Protein of unknown function (DUF3011)